VFVFTAALSPNNENPPTASSGSGNAVVTWDTATDQMTVNIAFGGLTSGTTASHIHCCAVPPANASVATTVPRFAGFPTGVTSGTYLHTLDMNDASSYNPSFVNTHGMTIASAKAALFAGLLAGQSYLNVHTTMFGGGEIRGVLVQP
jgi:CHRD domain-containing protein